MQWYAMLCYAMLCYEIGTKTASTHRRVRHILKYNIKKPKFTTYLQYEHLFFQIKTLKTEFKNAVCYAMLCYGLIWRMRFDEIVCYGIKFQCYVWDSNALLQDFNVMLCYSVCCKRYAWTDCKRPHWYIKPTYKNFKKSSTEAKKRQSIFSGLHQN